MANNYYDQTAELSFAATGKGLTPVIKAVFAGFRPETARGKVYISQGTEHNSMSWDDLRAELVTLGEDQQFDFGDVDKDDCEAVLHFMADQYLHDEGDWFHEWIDNKLVSIEEEESYTFEDAFTIATALDDGHGLETLSGSGAWTCDKMRNGEFGGDGQFVSGKVNLYGNSHTPINLGEKIHQALVAGDHAAAAEAIKEQVEILINCVVNDADRTLVRQQLIASL